MANFNCSQCSKPHSSAEDSIVCSLQRIAEAVESLDSRFQLLENPVMLANLVKEADRLVNEEENR